MTHKRTGKAARLRRQETASNRQIAIAQYTAHVKNMSPEERLLLAIFGAYEKCPECLDQKLVGSDCPKPNCKYMLQQVNTHYTCDYGRCEGLHPTPNSYCSMTRRMEEDPLGLS